MTKLMNNKLGDVEYWNTYSNGQTPEIESIEDFIQLMSDSIDIWQEESENELPEETQWSTVYFASVHKYKGGKIDPGVIMAMLAQL